MTQHAISVARAAAHVATFHHKTLVAGPYTGELGVELLDWSGYVRRLSTKYERTIVISYPGNRCLYEPCEYYAHEQHLGESGYWYGSLPASEVERILRHCLQSARLTKYDWLHPSHLNRITRKVIGPQLFMNPLRRGPANLKHDVAFHFRHMPRDADLKNYPIEAARELIERCEADGFRVCCIGHPEYALCPEGADDLRSRDLTETRQTLETVRIVAGGSSAPMHFASICGLPIIVWLNADLFAEPVVEKTYRGRGNPHKAPVFVASDRTFQPDPKRVNAEIVKALQSL